MKKIIISFILIFSVFLGANAQTDDVFAETDTDTDVLVNKNGITILPKQGDIAIGMCMNPIFTYLGNAFNGNVFNSAPTADFLSYPVGINNLYISGSAPQSSQIFLKYFLEDKAAVRVSFEYTGINTYDNQYVQDDAAILDDPLSNAETEDMLNVKGSTIVLGAGYEIRRGDTRLQGYAGGNIYFLIQNSKYLYSYGNPISDLNQEPTSVNWGGNILPNGGRKTAQYNGQTMGIGLGGFLGVEYFIIPRISLGAELGYGYMYYKQGHTDYDYEIWNVNEIEENVETQGPGNSGHMWGTGNPSINFFLMFHL